MRLERLEIAGFGRLRDRRFDFGSRVTVILGSNESGKSTLHRAVRGGLYGLDRGGQGRPLERSDWARWLPWTAGPYGLALSYGLEDGRRMRAAHRLDQREIRSQVQELGGGDVTDHCRFGRLVSPGRFHLGIDESVFCAAAWLGEEGLRLGAPDSPPLRAGELQEAIERLADSGQDGITAGEAVARLRAALQRVGSERRATSPLGVASSRLRSLTVEIDEARRRLSVFAEEEDRLRDLEASAATAAEDAVEAEREWLLGRLGGLDAQERELEACAVDLATLAADVEAHSLFAGFPAEDEDRMIALGGEMHQAGLGAAEAEARQRAAAEPLASVRGRRQEIAVGLTAMAAGPDISENVVEQARRLRHEIGVASVARRRSAALAATAARADAIRREIAGTGLGSLDATGLDALDRLLRAASSPARRRRVLAPAFGLLLMLGVAASMSTWQLGHRVVSALIAGITLLVLGGLAVAGRRGSGAGRRAHRELVRRLPGIELDAEGLEELAACLPGVDRLREELRRQQALADAHRTELEAVRRELTTVVDRCWRLAHECGIAAPAPPAPGSQLESLVAAGNAALDAVVEAAAIQQRRDELSTEDTRLSAREQLMVELAAEAEHRRRAVSEIEARIHNLVIQAGLGGSLPPLAAVAAFREACRNRREHDRAAAALVEVRRRHRLAGGDVDLIRRLRDEFSAELRRRGVSPDEVAAAPALGGRRLAELEASAQTAQNRAHAASAEARALRARLDGLISGLPCLADLEDERTAVAAARDRALRQAEALRRAIGFIESASVIVHRELAPRLAASVSARLALLTGRRYREVNVDTEHFAVSLLSRERAELVPLELASHGTRDQVALLLRLALCEVLSDGGEPVPLLLDEPLLSADLPRRRGLLEFLTVLSESNQVVLTTSDPGVAAAMAGLLPADGGRVTVIDLDDEQQPQLELIGAELSGAPQERSRRRR